MAPRVFDIAVVGHFSMDSIILPSLLKPQTVLGGSVAFVALAARQLDSSVAIISKIGLDFPKKYLFQLQSNGVDLSEVKIIKDERTTSFELTYSKDLIDRALCLRQKGSAIKVSDLPKSFKAKALLVAPIAGEISLSVMKKLKKFADCIAIDPQGLTRRFGKNGCVKAGAELNLDLLELVDIFKSSFEEICILTGQTDLTKALLKMHDLGPKIVIVTMGSQGSVLSNRGEICNVPVFNSQNVVDPTGAGDVFMGAFLAEYVHHKDLFWCACVGSAAASIIVEGVGTLFSRGKDEIYRRASKICEKEIKQ